MVTARFKESKFQAFRGFLSSSLPVNVGALRWVVDVSDASV